MIMMIADKHSLRSDFMLWNQKMNDDTINTKLKITFTIIQDIFINATIT